MKTRYPLAIHRVLLERRSVYEDVSGIHAEHHRKGLFSRRPREATRGEPSSTTLKFEALGDCQQHPEEMKVWSRMETILNLMVCWV